MAINRVDFPTTPNPVAGDWAKIVTLMTKAFQNINSPLQVDGSNIPQGATFQVGGVVYHADSDTAVTGSSSDYVKLTPNSGDGGATLDAAFVTSLSGVTWNKVYNAYYDVSGNLYIFDEVKAVLAVAIAGYNTKFGELWQAHAGQNLKTTDDPTFNDLSVATLSAAGTISGASINTGHGANELYAMNQNVRNTDDTKFNTVETTKGGRLLAADTLGDMYDFLIDILTSVGDKCLLCGASGDSGYNHINIFSFAWRYSSTVIRAYYIRYDATATPSSMYYELTSASGGTLSQCSIGILGVKFR